MFTRALSVCFTKRDEKTYSTAAAAAVTNMPSGSEVAQPADEATSAASTPLLPHLMDTLKGVPVSRLSRTPPRVEATSAPVPPARAVKQAARPTSADRPTTEPPLKALKANLARRRGRGKD